MKALKTRKLKQSIAAFVISIMMSANSHALIPTTDFANLVEGMLGNIQELFNWLEEQALMELEMQLQTALMGEETDANNAATARMITSLNKAQQDIQNTEIIRMFTPAGTACDTVTLGKSLDDIYCQASAAVTAARARKYIKDNNYDKNPTEQKKHVAEVAEDLVEHCQPDEDGESECLKLEYLFGDAPAGASDQDLLEIFEATERQVDLITGPLPPKRTDPRLGDTPTANVQRVNDYRLQAIKSVATESLLAVRGSYVVAEGAEGSELQALWAFVDKRWGDGDSDFIKKITNTHPDKESGAEFITTPSQVLREIGVMQAFQTYMSVLQYEQSLRAEAIDASLLSLELEPLK